MSRRPPGLALDEKIVFNESESKGSQILENVYFNGLEDMEESGLEDS